MTPGIGSESILIPASITHPNQETCPPAHLITIFRFTLLLTFILSDFYHRSGEMDPWVRRSKGARLRHIKRMWMTKITTWSAHWAQLCHESDITWTVFQGLVKPTRTLRTMGGLPWPCLSAGQGWPPTGRHYNLHHDF
jgi:hypothetical protein